MSISFIFPSSLFDSSIPDPSWESEFGIVSEMANSYLLDFMALEEGNFEKACRKVKKLNDDKFIYRGWFLTAEQYQKLNDCLISKNIELLNSPEQYNFCHFLHNWYGKLGRLLTPETLLFDPTEDIDLIQSGVEFNFPTESLIIKDSIRSQKFYWNEACFAKSSKKEDFISVLSKFIELQKLYSNGVTNFLAIRKFEKLQNIGTHKTGMPVSKEYRAFIYKGKIISLHKYWEEFNYKIDKDCKYFVEKIIKKIGKKSNFYTIDVAQKEDKNWICIEIGDGQVSCVQDKNSENELYQNILKIEGI